MQQPTTIRKDYVNVNGFIPNLLRWLLPNIRRCKGAMWWEMSPLLSPTVPYLAIVGAFTVIVKLQTLRRLVSNSSSSLEGWLRVGIKIQDFPARQGRLQWTSFYPIPIPIISTKLSLRFNPTHRWFMQSHGKFRHCNDPARWLFSEVASYNVFI